MRILAWILAGFLILLAAGVMAAAPKPMAYGYGTCSVNYGDSSSGLTCQASGGTRSWDVPSHSAAAITLALGNDAVAYANAKVLAYCPEEQFGLYGTSFSMFDGATAFSYAAIYSSGGGVVAQVTSEAYIDNLQSPIYYPVQINSQCIVSFDGGATNNPQQVSRTSWQ